MDSEQKIQKAEKWWELDWQVLRVMMLEQKHGGAKKSLGRVSYMLQSASPGCARLTAAVITILQVLIALVAAGVSGRVSDQTTALGQQLLLRPTQAAAFWVTAACQRKTQHASVKFVLRFCNLL